MTSSTGIADSVDAALKRARAAVKVHPRDATLHLMLADLYEQTGRTRDAVPHLQFLVSVQRKIDESLSVRYVRALFQSGAINEAERAADDALRQLPGSCALMHSKALVLLLLGDFEQALATYRAIRALDSGDRRAAGMAGFIRLLVSDMREGYEEYAERPRDHELAIHFQGIPAWSGESFAGKRIVLWSEQGVGDVVMFLVFLPLVARQAREVAVVVTEKLAPLIRRSFPDIEVISEYGVRGIIAKSFDVHVPLGDLLRVGVESITGEQPEYLKADEVRAADLQAKYRAIAATRGRHRLVGLSWHTTNPDMGFTRNIGLDELAPVFSVKGIQFVSLQYGGHGDAIAQINRRYREVLHVDEAVDAFADLDALAAQIKAMDEVVTIDNSTVHLAGALGVPTTLLLPTCPDWRWGLVRSDCRWYRSVTCERQAAILKWKPVINRVRTRLEAHA